MNQTDPMWWPRPVANAGAMVAGAVLVAALVLAGQAPTTGVLVNSALGLLAVPLYAGLGVLVAHRVPRNPVGALLSLLALAFALTVAAQVLPEVLATAQATPSQAVTWLVEATGNVGVWILVLVGLLLLHYPDGRLASPRWGVVRWVLVVGGIVASVEGAVSAPSRLVPDVPGWVSTALAVSFGLVLVAVVASAASLLVRRRRADPVVRAQITWLALVGTAVPMWPILCLVEIGIWGRPLWLSAAVGVLALVGIPVATSIAMLHHDLYDVDKAFAATVTWILLSAGLVTVYGLTALAAGLALGRGSAVAAAAATALCAVLLAPMRGRVQALVDARIYPLRRAALEAVDDLHQRVSAGTARPEDLQQTLRAALRDPELAVGFRHPQGTGFVDADGHEVLAEGAVAVTSGVVVTGIVLPGSAASASAGLVGQVARRCAVLVEMVRLRSETERALREVEASRHRLVQVSLRERRRLERDLHDGAQARLVSLGMALRLSQGQLSDGSVDANALIERTLGELRAAVAELRQIAHGLRPGALDHGLGSALRSMAGRLPVPVEIEVALEGSEPDPVVTTAYYVASEAIANAVKHADAELIRVHVSRCNGAMLVRVHDDGRGGARLRASTLADRVAALNGSLHVDSPPDGGTRVEAVLPCES
jgi:signal transduction histidine kinase